MMMPYLQGFGNADIGERYRLTLSFGLLEANVGSSADPGQVSLDEIGIRVGASSGTSGSVLVSAKGSFSFP